MSPSKIEPLLGKLVETCRSHLGRSAGGTAALVILVTGDDLTVATFPARPAAKRPKPGVVDLRYLDEHPPDRPPP